MCYNNFILYYLEKRFIVHSYSAPGNPLAEPVRS